MANMRVFVSSTAYDLAVLRSSLRTFIEGLGYDAILSDYSDVVFSPTEHAHKSCLTELTNCDLVVLVIGSRFGSPLDPSLHAAALDGIETDALGSEMDEIKLSVTQAEALTAASRQIPIYAFVDSNVLHDYSVYQQNKGKSFANEIKYPSIAQPETAEYIFRFIDYLQSRSVNNAVVSFSRLEDLLTHLRKQWAGLFQRLLSEGRLEIEESIRIDRLTEKFDDLKAAMLATVGDADTRAVARGVVRFRRVIDFMRSFSPPAGTTLREVVIGSTGSFYEVLDEAFDIEYIRVVGEGNPMTRVVLLVRNGGAYRSRLPLRSFEVMAVEWEKFVEMGHKEREVIFDAITEFDTAPTYLRRIPRDEAEALLAQSVDPEATTAPDGTSSTLKMERSGDPVLREIDEN